MGEGAIDPGALPGLAAKLHGLDLSDDERRLLDVLLDRAAAFEPEVEGYGVVFEVETTVKAGQPMGAKAAPDDWVRKIASATGTDLSQLPGVWTDMRPLS